MKTSIRAALAAAAAASLALAACGVEYAGEDPELGQYEQPLTDSTGALVCSSPKKVLICHVPPGNPANAHSICVGAAAKPAHERHGDRSGACDAGAAATDAGSVTPAVDAGSSAGGTLPDGGVAQIL